MNRGKVNRSATVHFVDEGTDTVPIIIKKRPVLDDDNP
jgi:folate-dependent phosphoribosylglycinamide formyltransferase PurN